MTNLQLDVRPCSERPYYLRRTLVLEDKVGSGTEGIYTVINYFCTVINQLYTVIQLLKEEDQEEKVFYKTNEHNNLKGSFKS